MNACYWVAQEAGWLALLVAMINALIPKRTKR
jgi:hypothetical protein